MGEEQSEIVGSDKKVAERTYPRAFYNPVLKPEHEKFYRGFETGEKHEREHAKEAPIRSGTNG